MRANESQQQANKKEWNEVYSSHPILWINVEITAYDDGKGEVLVRLRFRYKERKWRGESRRRETEEVFRREKKRESFAKSRCCRNSSWSSCHLGLQAWTLLFFWTVARGPIAILGSSLRKMACWLYKRMNSTLLLTKKMKTLSLLVSWRFDKHIEWIFYYRLR